MATHASTRLASITPRHEVRDVAHRDAIAASMSEDGWIGRPLVVVDSGDGYLALTGSHRLAAARLAGLDEVPVLVAVLPDGAEVRGEDIRVRGCRLTDQEELLEMLRESDPDAAAVMAEEPGL